MKNMKVTKPQDKDDILENVKEYVEKFEDMLTKEKNGKNYYFLVVSGEINRKICDRIEEIYKNAGWGDAICKTSSENGERGGLTGLQLWR